MGQACCPGSPTNKLINDQMNKRQEIFRILLLGAGESGKTTVRKQMSLLYGGGFDDSFRRNIRPSVFGNLIEGAYKLIEAGREDENLRIMDENTRKAAIRTKTYYLDNSEADRFEVPELNKEIADDLATLLADEKFQKSMAAAARYMLPDGWKYFMEKIKDYPKWGGVDWMPDDSDVLHVRVRTVGINRVMLKYTPTERGSTFPMEVIDVGGQQSERAKWVNVFQGINSILYLQSMSDYDMLMFENMRENRLEDSLSIWARYTRLPEFKNTSFIVFLNKADLMRDKFVGNRVPIDSRFGEKGFLEEVVNKVTKGGFVCNNDLPVPIIPDAQLSEEGANRMTEVVSGWFIELMRILAPADLTIYAHVTTATASTNMKAIFGICLQDIFTKALNLGGFTE